MTTIFAILASFMGMWAFFKYILLVEMRVDSNTYKTVYDLCGNEKKFMIYEEFVSENRHPVAYVAFCFFKSTPWFHMNHSERLMQAGFNEKDHVTVLTCFRWKYDKLKSFLRTKLKEMQLCTLGRKHSQSRYLRRAFGRTSIKRSPRWLSRKGRRLALFFMDHQEMARVFS